MKKNNIFNLIRNFLIIFLCFIFIKVLINGDLVESNKNNSINNINSSVNVFVESDLKGKPLCSTGEYIENIYFNVDSKPEDFINKIDDIAINLLGSDLNSLGELYMPLLISEDSTKGLVFFYENGLYILAYFDEDSEKYLFTLSHDDSINDMIVSEIGFLGWDLENLNLTGYLSLNCNSLDLTEELGGEILLHQEFLNGISSFISSTLFEQKNENIILSGEYDGSSITINDSVVDLRPFLENNKLPLDIYFSNNNEGVKFKEIVFEKGITPNSNDTFICNITDEEKSLLGDFVLNKKTINGLSSIINININAADKKLFYGFSLNNTSGFGASGNNLSDFIFTNGYYLIEFKILDNILYLNYVHKCNLNFIGNELGYIIDSSTNLVDSVESISLFIPYV